MVSQDSLCQIIGTRAERPIPSPSCPFCSICMLLFLLQFWGSSDSKRGNSTHSTGTHEPMFYCATRWGSEMTWGNWQEQARAVHLASPLTSLLIHLFQGEIQTPHSHALHSLPSDHWSASLLIDITVQRNIASNQSSFEKQKNQNKTQENHNTPKQQNRILFK